MKGTIVNCLGDLITEQFGRDAWTGALTAAGLPSSTLFLPIQDIDDATVVSIVNACCTQCGLSMTQAADAFGEYWANDYSQRLFPHYYTDCSSAKEFLLKMDEVHVMMTRRVKDAKPPRFEYEWRDENTLLMHYKSHRGLIDFAVGLAKGVGSFYNETLTVTKVGSGTVKISFPRT